MFKTNESIEALCSFIGSRRIDIGALAHNLEGVGDERLRKLKLLYTDALINAAARGFHQSWLQVATPALPKVTASYTFERRQEHGIQVTDRSTGNTFTTIDAIVTVGSPQFPAVVEVRFGGRAGHISEYFRHVGKKISAFSEFAPNGFGWILALAKEFKYRPSPFLDEFKRMNGHVVLLPYSATAFRGVAAYHKTG